jgi:mycofactocin system glycosyltransferase
VSSTQTAPELSWVRPPEHATLPPGCKLSLDAQAVRLEGELLAGGSPYRLMRLSERGAAMVSSWMQGAPLEDDPAAIALASHLVHAGLVNPSWTSSRWTKRDLSIVIPHRNRVDGLERLLGQLEGFETIVVDDASDDAPGLTELVERHGAMLLARRERGGPGAARNTGLRTVTSPLVAFVDSDCSLAPGWLEPLLAQMNDPVVAAVAPRIVGEGGEGARARFERDCSALDMGTEPSLVRAHGAVAFVPAAVLLVRSDLGPVLFDESLEGGEDVDLVWRLDQLGWTVRYEPSSLVGHTMRGSLEDWLGQRFSYGLSAAALEARHGELAAPLRASPWSLASWGLAGLGHPLAAGASFTIGVEQLRRKLSPLSGRPGPLAWQLSTRSLARGGPALARQLLRSYGPLMLLGSLFSKRLRRLSAGAVLVAGLDRWHASESELDLPSFVLYSTLDDLSYSAGVLAGAVQRRRAGALLPRLVGTRTDSKRAGPS